MNVVSCGIAAKVTGQSYTGWDIAAAAFSGAIPACEILWRKTADGCGILAR